MRTIIIEIQDSYLKEAAKERGMDERETMLDFIDILTDAFLNDTGITADSPNIFEEEDSGE